MKIRKCILILLIFFCSIDIFKSMIRIVENQKVIYITDSKREELGDLISGTSFNSAGVWKITYARIWLEPEFKIYFVFDKTIKKGNRYGHYDEFAEYMMNNGMDDRLYRSNKISYRCIFLNNI